MSYAWIIDTDHAPDDREPEGTNSNAKGVTGPRRASDLMIDTLVKRRRVELPWQVFTFRMYDDDGELYYTGRLLTDDPMRWCLAPLDDFGAPNAGATEVKYQGHPDMDC